jgi:hypothetical protein
MEPEVIVGEESPALYESNVFELIFRTTECGELVRYSYLWKDNPFIIDVVTIGTLRGNGLLRRNGIDRVNV